MVEIITDVGSCHMGKLDLAKEHIHVAALQGADIVKFQLFHSSPGNIPLPPGWIPELMSYCEEQEIKFACSFFDEYSLNHLNLCGLKILKIAYSQRNAWFPRKLASMFDRVIRSGDLMDNLLSDHDNIWCIPQYPVTHKIEFEGIFKRFKGFSDHTLGIKQTKEAIKAGARIIEKHFKLNDSRIDCPDAKFAITPEELGTLTNWSVTQ